jgi:hypothetical protein
MLKYEGEKFSNKRHQPISPIRPNPIAKFGDLMKMDRTSDENNQAGLPSLSRRPRFPLVLSTGL